MSKTPEFEEIDLEAEDYEEEELKPLTPAEKEKMIARLKAMTELYEHCEADAKKLEALIDELPVMFQREKELMDYYYSEWRQDYEHADEIPPAEYLGITSEDTIWNTMVGLHQGALQILKLLINHIVPSED